MIVVNAIRTPDGTILQSKYRHDCITYNDKLDGQLYGVDGGLDYLKRIGGTNYKELSIVDVNYDFEEIRKMFVWGTRGKGGEEELKWVKLKDIDNDHLEELIKYTIKNKFNILFIKELNRRKSTNRDRAFYLVKELYKDKSDKLGNNYINHLLQVERFAIKLFDANDEMRAVCLLHDVLEDFNNKELIKEFSTEIHTILGFLTRNKETYDDYIKRCSYNKIAKNVKICDLLSNLDTSRFNNKNQILEMQSLRERGTQKH